MVARTDLNVGSAARVLLRDEARAFARHRNAWILAAYVGLAAAVRAILQEWTAGDTAVVLGMVAAQPFVEWLIHVFVLHFKPREMFGRRVDPAIARSHRRHHQDPRNPRFIFIDVRALAVAVPVGIVLYHLVFPTRELATTAIMTAAALTLAYEWTHFLIHTDYKPRHWPYRRVYRAHRLHHFRNENYWFGVTSTVGDHVLRTFPDRDAVPASPTARTLGVPVG